MIFIVLSSWPQGHCESSLGSFDERLERHQAATNPQIKPCDLGCEFACSAAIIYNHHRHLLLIIRNVAIHRTDHPIQSISPEWLLVETPNYVLLPYVIGTAILGQKDNNSSRSLGPTEFSNRCMHNVLLRWGQLTQQRNADTYIMADIPPLISWFSTCYLLLISLCLSV